MLFIYADEIESNFDLPKTMSPFSTVYTHKPFFIYVLGFLPFLRQYLFIVFYQELFSQSYIKDAQFKRFSYQMKAQK